MQESVERAKGWVVNLKRATLRTNRGGHPSEGGNVGQVIVFLRGINVGKTKRMAMADLRLALEQAGLRRVRTLLQSGNVVVETSQSPAQVEITVARAIQERFGFDVDVLARTEAEMAAVVEGNPLRDVAVDGAKYHVLFLAGPADPGFVQEIRERDHDPERVVVTPREIYVWCAAGVLESRALKLLTERRLGTIVTARNWNTVVKAWELARAG